MDWIQTLTIIGVNIALIGSCMGVLIFMVNKLDADIRSSNQRHESRIDQLYSMFCDLQKQIKEEAQNFHGRLCSIEERNKKK